jgi:hypothetical protein
MEGDVLTRVLHSSSLELGEYCFLASAQHKKVLKIPDIYFPKGLSLDILIITLKQ